MADQWFTLEQIKQEQKACPLSIGQAEAGRYTFCIGDQCMAWKWLTDELLTSKIGVDDDIPEGYKAASEPFKDGKKMSIKIVQIPTHGRCGMVPRDAS